MKKLCKTFTKSNVCDHKDPTRCLVGICDVKAYKKALSQRQIKRIYDKGITKPKPFVYLDELKKICFSPEYCAECGSQIYKAARKIAKERMK